MKILEYSYKGSGWDFSKVSFKKLNLLVGDSGTGKTRFLNTLFNLGHYVGNSKIGSGDWEVKFRIDNSTYRWEIQGEVISSRKKILLSEKLYKIVDEEEILLIDRDQNKFIFNDQKLPKLSSEEYSISILREEEEITPIYDGFRKMLRRRFSEDALVKNTGPFSITEKILEDIGKTNDLFALYSADLPINPRMYILSKYFSNIYEEIISQYKQIFPFIKSFGIRNATEFEDLPSLPGNVPIFSIKEKDIDQWIPLHALSSGMQKVLLVFVDILTLPEGSVYMIDEYENSLGISAIDFFPNFMFTVDKDIQLFLTSHHPYLINNIPSSNWYIFHRSGSHISILHGDNLAERFGKSKQQAFIQLINDPFYTEGVE